MLKGNSGLQRRAWNKMGGKPVGGPRAEGRQQGKAWELPKPRQCLAVLIASLQVTVLDRQRKCELMFLRIVALSLNFFSPAKVFLGEERVRALPAVNRSQAGHCSQWARKLGAALASLMCKTPARENMSQAVNSWPMRKEDSKTNLQRCYSRRLCEPLGQWIVSQSQ